MRKFILLSGLLFSTLAATTPAAATSDVYAFSLLSGSDSATTGNSGNNQNEQINTVTLSTTAWNLNYNSTTGKYDLTSAYLGTYTYGVGVTSGGDNLAGSTYNINGSNYSYDCTSGDCGTHQVDNMGNTANSQSYDFVELTFNKAVTLTGLTLNSFGTANAANNAFQDDTDFTYANLTTALTAGTSYTSLSQLFGASNSANVSQSVCEGSTYGNVCTDSWSAGAGDVVAGKTSKIWLVAASVAANYGGDGKVDSFKVATVDVGAVPEPATWASMVLGFGVAGFALRRRRAAELRTA